MGIAAAMASAILFSGKGVLMKLAFMHGASIWLFMALRMAYAFPIFLFLWFRALRQAREQGLPELAARDWFIILILGLVGYYLSGVMDIAGLLYVSAGMERLILYTHPSLVVIFGWLFFRRTLSRPLIFAMLLGYGGLVMAFGEEARVSPMGQAWKGVLLIFGSAVTYALFLIYSGKHIQRLGPERLFIGGMMVCTVMVLAQAVWLVPSGEWLASVPVHGYAVVVAILGTVVPTLLLGTALRALGPERTAVLGMVGPVFTLFLGHFTLQEPLTWLNAAGLALTLVGGWILSRESRMKKVKAAA